MPHPLRLLIAAYAAAAVTGLGLSALGLAGWAAALAAWLAAPPLVVALSFLPWLSRRALPPARLPSAADWIAEEEELRNWDRDLAADTPSTAQRPGSATG